MQAFEATCSPVPEAHTTAQPGRGSIAFFRCATRTVVGRALAASPLRILTPRNHGDGAWVFLSSFGGGLVDGDGLDVDIDAAAETLAFVGTQASTKVYRSARGTRQKLAIRAADGAAVALVPDPVVAFAGARYAQQIDVVMARDASLALFDAYTCGRAARGERWAFARFESRTKIVRDGRLLFVDSTRLDPAHGSIAERMGGFDVVACVVAIGPRFASMRDTLRAAAPSEATFSDETSAPPPRSPAIGSSPGARATAVCSTSPLGSDGIVLRIAADHFENASRVLRASFGALAGALGDDPFSRKW
jgi:urease accessory protein